MNRSFSSKGLSHSVIAGYYFHLFLNITWFSSIHHVCMCPVGRGVVGTWWPVMWGGKVTSNPCIPMKHHLPSCIYIPVLQCWATHRSVSPQHQPARGSHLSQNVVFMFLPAPQVNTWWCWLVGWSVPLCEHVCSTANFWQLVTCDNL